MRRRRAFGSPMAQAWPHAAMRRRVYAGRTATGLVACAAAIAATALLLAGCGSSGSGSGTSTAASAGTSAIERQLQAHEWVLDRASSSLRAADSHAITIRFASGGNVSGVAPCNSYRGTYALSAGAAIRISGVSQTLRACDARADAAEREYLAALQSVHVVATLDPQHLAMDGPSHTRLAYDALDVTSAIAGTWEVTNISRDDAIRGVTPGLHPSLTVAAGGAVAYASACGRREGTWMLSGDRLTIPKLEPAAGSCAAGTPAALDDAAIVDAAVGTTMVDLAPGMLTLLSPDGRILLIANR
jgi:heat shock protein HslJ